jgi:hypothetical protein
VSIKVMTDVWAYADCKGSELLMLLALADFSDDHGENIYPSMQTLAEKTRLHETQARRSVQALVKRDLLEIIEPGGWQHGRNRSNSYRIKLENLGDSKMLPPLSRPRDHGDSTGAPTVVVPARDDPSSKSLYNAPSKGKRPTQGRKNGGKRRSYNPDDYDDL